MANRVLQKKICMLGYFGVGKSSLIRRFVYDKYEDLYLSTIGVKVSQKMMPPLKAGDGTFCQFNFMLWDIEGFDETSRTMRNYYSGASGALLVCDLSRADTIEMSQNIMDTFRQVCPQGQLVLAGNKRDLVKPGSETIGQLQRLADQNRLTAFLSSAKTGENVEKSFLHLAGLLLGGDREG